MFLLSLAAALNPILVGASTIMMLLPNPKRLMLGYLLGAYMTSITLGMVIVFALQGSSAVNTTESTVSPAVDLALGAIMLIAAFVSAPAATRASLSDGARAKAPTRRRGRRVGKRR